jgi:DNA-binding transcriptional MerR regulator
MDTDPQHEAGSGLDHRVPNGFADSTIQSNDLPEAEANSRLSTIREMARDFQVSIRALRFYEDRGLLHPRRENTNRRYDARDRLHLKMILKGKQLGFTLSEIHDILACRGEDSGDTELEMRLLPEQISAQISYLERQRSQIDAAINTLREAHRRLPETARREARVFPSDPAIREDAEIVGRVFRQGPAPTLSPISTIFRVAFVFAPLRRTDEGLGACRYPCQDAEGKTGPAGRRTSAGHTAAL